MGRIFDVILMSAPPAPMGVEGRRASRRRGIRWAVVGESGLKWEIRDVMWVVCIVVRG